jgi:hypothetical protein
LTDKTVPKNLTSRASEGRFLRVPLLTGNNAQEGDIFIAGQQILLNGTIDPTTFYPLSEIRTRVIIFLVSFINRWLKGYSRDSAVQQV